MYTFKSRYTNGDILKDNLTGLTGEVICISHYATGCVHYAIVPNTLKSDGTIHEASWLDESRLVLVKNKVSNKFVKPHSGPSPVDKSMGVVRPKG
jgi:hypothetical protein